MTPLQIAGTGFVLLTGVVGATIGIEARYESASAANTRHELLAADQEAGRLDTERQLIELELKMLEGKAEKTEADKARIEYLRQRRMLIEARLLDSQKKA